MASPSVVGTPTETAISTASTSHTVDLPSGATGNLLIAIMSKGSAGTTPTVNALAGWNELLDEAQTLGLYIAWRTCDGTEGTTTTFTLSSSTRGAWIVYEITGHIDPTTQAPQIGTTATGSSTSPDPPSVSVAGGSKDILTIACFGRSGEEADDDTWVSAAPSGFGGLLQKACGTAGTNLAGMVATAHLAQTTATANPGAFTAATGAWRAQTIVVHPAPPPTQTSVAEVSLGSGGTPTSRTQHSIKVRARTTSGAGTIKAALYEGATNRSGDLESSALTTSLADYTLAIPDASAANITDYSNLSIRFWGYAAGGGSIVFEVDQLWLEIPEAAAGGTTTPQALTATSTLAATVVRSVGKRISGTGTASATISRQVAKAISATVTSSASVVKRAGKAITANAAASASMTAIKVIVFAMTATVTSSATMVRRSGKTVSGTATATASIVKQVGKRVTATATVTATVGAIKVLIVNLSATVTATATIVRRAGKTMSATAAVTASVAMNKTFGKAISATVTSTATMIRQIGKRLSATSTATATVSAIRAVLKTMTATVATTATMSRQVGLRLTGTITVAATIVKQTTRRLTATVTTTASMVAQRAFLKAMQATVTTTATIRRSVTSTLVATVSSSASLTKSVGKQLATGITVTTSVVADFLSQFEIFITGRFGRPTPGGRSSGSPSAGEFDGPSPGGVSRADPGSSDFDRPTPRQRP